MLKRFSMIAVLALSTAVIAADKPAQKKKPSTRPVVKQELVAYPLDTCLVSGEEFGGDMGDPYVFAHDGREIKLCCKSCLKKFNKDTDKYLKTFDEAAAKKKDQKPAEKK